MQAAFDIKCSRGDWGYGRQRQMSGVANAETCCFGSAGGVGIPSRRGQTQLY